jgi:hypothetical protein
MDGEQKGKSECTANVGLRNAQDVDKDVAASNVDIHLEVRSHSRLSGLHQ